MRVLCLVLLVLAVGCGDSIVGLDSAFERDPYPVMLDEYAQAEACMGLTGDVDGVVWWEAPDIRRDGYRWTQFGAFRPPGNIYLHSDVWNSMGDMSGDYNDHVSPDVVEHEAMHHIRYVNGMDYKGHPSEWAACDPLT